MGTGQRRICVVALRQSGGNLVSAALRRVAGLREMSFNDLTSEPALQTKWSDETQSFGFLIGPADLERHEQVSLGGSALYRIVVMRHPLAWSSAVRERRSTSYASRIELWLSAHEALLYRSDLRRQSISVVQIEEYLASPEKTLNRSFDELGLDLRAPGLVHQDQANERQQLRKTHLASSEVQSVLPMLDRFEESVSRLGYRLFQPPTIPSRASKVSLQSDRTSPSRQVARQDRKVRRTPPDLPASNLTGKMDSQVLKHLTKTVPLENSRSVSARQRSPDGIHDPAAPLREDFVFGRRPLRVGFLTPSLCLGGAERWMISLAAHSVSSQIDWVGTILAPWGASDLKLSAELRRIMPIYSANTRLSDPSITLMPSPNDAVGAVANRADILLAWGTTHAFAKVKAAGCEVVFVSHCSFQSTATSYSSKLAKARLVAVSQSAARPFSTVDARRVTIIHNGIESGRCVPTITAEAMRTLWGFDRHHKLIGYVGRLSPEKNPLAVARAVHYLGDTYRGLYIGGDCSNDSIRRAAIDIAGDRVKFISPLEPIGNALAALDAFILASPSEGFSLALAEAWFVGVPTVATRVGAVPELEEKHGQLTIPVAVDSTPEQLGTAVLLALSDENRSTILRAKKVMQHEYTAASMAKRWYDYMHDIFTKRSLVSNYGCDLSSPLHRRISVQKHVAAEYIESGIRNEDQ